MSRQFALDDGGYVSDIGSRQFAIGAGGYLKETSAISYTDLLSFALTADFVQTASNVMSYVWSIDVTIGETWAGGMYFAESPAFALTAAYTMGGGVGYNVTIAAAIAANLAYTSTATLHATIHENAVVAHGTHEISSVVQTSFSAGLAEGMYGLLAYGDAGDMMYSTNIYSDDFTQQVSMRIHPSSHAYAVPSENRMYRVESWR